MDSVGMWLDYILFAQSRQQLPAAEITLYPQGPGPDKTAACSQPAFIAALPTHRLHRTCSCHFY